MPQCTFINLQEGDKIFSFSILFNHITFFSQKFSFRIGNLKNIFRKMLDYVSHVVISKLTLTTLFKFFLAAIYYIFSHRENAF